MSGQVAVLFLINLLVFPLQVLGFLLTKLSIWSDRRWGHVDGVRFVPNIASCRVFCSVPGPLQSVQRAVLGSHFGLADF